MTVRVRFAPSPTGFLHVGGARTALFNYLFARGRDGTMVLRSDDTDVARSTPEFQEDIVAGMRWLGLDWDEGIEVGGPHAPYRQSERLARYQEVAEGMVASGAAYPCFCAARELEERRAAAMKEGRPPGYDGRCRSIPAESAAERRAGGEQASVRVAVPRPGATAFRDVVRGETVFDHANVDDFVILRSSGMPTYHLASAVDDVDFGITHVVRGEDLLSSTPKHILIGEAVGGDPIVYAHLSLLHGPDGKKLSKRHGDTSLRAYRDAGILPEAMVNYLALLGWSPGDDETKVARADMIERFALEDVSRNPAVFDPAKLEWLNGAYIRDLDVAEFTRRAITFVEPALGRPLEDREHGMLAALAPLVQERAKRLTDVAGQVAFLFTDDVERDDAAWGKVMGGPEARVALEGALAALDSIEWSADAIEGALRAMIDERGLSVRKGLQPLRVAMCGSTVSPPLFESLEVLGRDRTLERFRAAFADL